MKLGRVAARSDTGRRRMRNEDYYINAPPLFAIADGMGGARAGEVAAGLAAAEFEQAGSGAHDAESIEALITEANRRIWERSLADPATSGMGTTVTAALFEAAANAVTFGHVGDSRAYRYREGVVEQVTTDHSLVAELVESGVLTPEEAENHPQRSAITRALGTEPSVEVDVFSLDVQPGDLFLLCSDGLSDMVGDEQLAELIERAGADPERAAEALVAAANANGGEDNVTVVLFEIVADDVPDAVPSADVGSIDLPAGTDGRPTEAENDAAPGDDAVKRHGAGKGGRVAAILLVLAALVAAALVVYWGVAR